jgi:alkylation response protein AidB-like acyl-CoA dehydrogenase
MDLSDERALVRDSVREFVEREVEPVAAEAERTATFPEDVWDALADIDLHGLRVPEAYGGLDADMQTYALVSEELARGHLALATAFVGVVFVVVLFDPNYQWQKLWLLAGVFLAYTEVIQN